MNKGAWLPGCIFACLFAWGGIALVLCQSQDLGFASLIITRSVSEGLPEYTVLPRLRFGLLWNGGIRKLSFDTALADEGNQELVDLIVQLLGEPDKELRSTALEQIRHEAKGEGATRQFASQLPKLGAEAQLGLLAALAERGDAVALPAILELAQGSSETSVRSAAIAAVGSLGGPAELPLLLKWAESEAPEVQEAVRGSLIRLPGTTTNSLLAAEVKSASPKLQSILIEVLAERRAFDTVPQLLPGLTAAEPPVRYASMIAVARLAGPEHIPAMLRGVLAARAGPEREAAEKGVVAVCERSGNQEQKSAPVIAAWNQFSEAEQLILLSTVGRLGGPASLELVEQAMSDSNPERRTAGLEALCKWPDATVADRLLALAQPATDAYERDLTFGAFVRVGSLRDKARTDQDRFVRLQQAMALANKVEEKALVLKAFRQAYLIDSLRHVVKYLDQPEYTAVACETIVELAHHRELREPHKAEFDAALDRVLAVSTDSVVKDRADRYKKGQTWYRPQREPPSLDFLYAPDAPPEAEVDEAPPAAQFPLVVMGIGALVAVVVLGLLWKAATRSAS